MASIEMATTLSSSFGVTAELKRNPGFAVVMAATFGLFAPLPKDLSLSANLSASFGLKGSLFREVPIHTRLSASFTIKGCLDRGRDAIGVCEVIADILHLWGFTNPRNAPDYAVNRALTDLNAALQVVWNQADERSYWNRDTLTIMVPALEIFSPLPDAIQNVTGTCRLKSSRRPLTTIGTLGEFETFSDIYLSGEEASEPIAYHVDRQTQGGNDPVRCTFYVTPAPTMDTEFLLEVVKESPRYGIRDIANCPRIPIPHRYVESLLLPVARYRATSYYLFDSLDKKEAIDAEYMEARRALGLADPLPGDAGDNRNKRREVSV